MYEVGDIVLVPKGQKTRFFEVIRIEERQGYVWISDGYVQITKAFHDIELICKATERKDKKVPVMRYMK